MATLARITPAPNSYWRACLALVRASTDRSRWRAEAFKRVHAPPQYFQWEILNTLPEPAFRESEAVRVTDTARVGSARRLGARCQTRSARARRSGLGHGSPGGGSAGAAPRRHRRRLMISDRP